MACVVLWDLAALPGVDDAAVGVTAKRFAKARYSLTADVKAFGDVSSLSPALRYSLHVAGVQLNDSVESGLISEMFCWAWDNRPPATIIILNVANATKQLRSALAKLVDRGYTVVVLEPPGATAEEAVWGAEHVAWAAVEAAVAGQDAPMMSSSESSVCSSVVHQRRSEDDALLTERRSSTLDYTERRSTLDWSKDYRSRDAWSDALAARNDWGTSSSSSSSEPPPPPQPRSFGSSPKRRASSPRHSSEWSRSDWSRSEAAAHSPKTNWAAQTRTDWASPQSLRRSSQSDCLGSSQSSRSDCLRLSQDSPQTLQPLPRGYFQGPPHALEALRRSGFHDICALLRHVHKHKRPTSHVVPNDAVPKSLLIAAARELSGFPRIVVECTRAARAGMIVTGGAHPNEWVRASSDRNDSTPVGTPPPPRGSPCDSAHASPGSECSLEFIRGSAVSAGVLVVGGAEPHEWIRLRAAPLPQMPSLSSLAVGDEAFGDCEAFASSGGLVRGGLCAKQDDFSKLDDFGLECHLGLYLEEMHGQLKGRGLGDLGDCDASEGICCSKVTRSSSEELSSSATSLADGGPSLLAPDSFRASLQPERSPFETMLFPTAVELFPTAV